MCVRVCVGVSGSACWDQRGRRQSWEEKFPESMRQVFFCMKEQFEGKIVPLEAAAAAIEVCKQKVAVMSQSETEVTSLRRQELRCRIVLR